MSYKAAIHHAHQVLALASKTSKYVKDVFDSSESDLESIRLKTIDYEMVIAQHGNFTMIAIQSPAKTTAGDVKVEEKKEGDGEKKEAA
jgi:hypothetical protein